MVENTFYSRNNFAGKKIPARALNSDGDHVKIIDRNGLLALAALGATPTQICPRWQKRFRAKAHRAPATRKLRVQSTERENLCTPCGWSLSCCSLRPSLQVSQSPLPAITCASSGGVRVSR